MTQLRINDRVKVVSVIPNGYDVVALGEKGTVVNIIDGGTHDTYPIWVKIDGLGDQFGHWDFEEQELELIGRNNGVN